LSRAGFRIVLEIERGLESSSAATCVALKLVIGVGGIELGYSYLDSILETNAVLSPINVVD
jgi:hypothetical protein